MDYCLRKESCGGRAVARDVVRLGRNLFDELCAHVLEGVFKFDFLCDCYAVVSDERSAELLVEHNVPALRPESHLNGVCERIYTGFDSLAGVFAEFNLLCHVSFLLIQLLPKCRFDELQCIPCRRA